MIRKNTAFAVLLLLLFSLLSGSAGAEEGPALATPTDLTCLHGQTKTIIYFYDSPAYISLNDDSHRVSGPATVETVCADCGEVLSSEVVARAEETRPHVFKKGTCVLCGYREIQPAEEAPAGTQEEKPVGSREEWTVTAGEESGNGVLSVTLTSSDLYELEKQNVSIALVRGKTGEAVVALNVTEVLRQTEAAGASLQVQLAEREDGSFFAALFLVSESGERTRLSGAGITLRFYRNSKADVRVSLSPAGQDTLVETESVWNEKGYWSVPYTEEGTYFVLE